MQPKVSTEILSNVVIAAIHPPDAGGALGVYSVQVTTADDRTRYFPFETLADAQTFFNTLEVKSPEPVDLDADVKARAADRLYTKEEVKEIVDAAVQPLDPVPTGPVAGFWSKVRARWKSISVGLSVISVLLSGYVTFKVGFGPVKVPDINITLPESQKPDKDVEARIPE